jgi:hypothetical protein
MSEIANEYLVASGATALCIVKHRAGYGVQVGRNVAKLPGVVAVQWIDSRVAASVARQARCKIDRRLTISGVTDELVRAAAARGATLTPDLIVVSRAKRAAQKVERYLADGQQEFDAEYKRRRAEAGSRFMSYKTAHTRFRREVIASLVERETIGPMRSLIAAVFHVKQRAH